MQLLTLSSKCSEELSDAVLSASVFSDIFTNLKPLAYHSECSVYLATAATSTQNQQQFVVKSYRRHALSAAAREQVQTEIQIHSSLNHPNVVAFLLAFEDCRNVHLVLECSPQGDLRKHLGSMDMNEQRIRDVVVVPLLHALSYVHSKGVSHRDLKPENVLVNEAGTSVQLADFGMSLLTHVSEDACSTSTSSCDSSLSAGSPSSRCASANSSSTSLDSECSLASTTVPCCSAGGTPLYAAPEVLQAMFKNHGMQRAVGPKNDIWALGVLALEAYTGSHPFSPDLHHYGNVLYSIANHKHINFPPSISQDFLGWLQQALQKDPDLRPSASELLDHPWLRKEYQPEELAQVAGCGRTALTQDRMAACMAMPFDAWEY